MGFPDYYRINWNSFDEIISDPSWMSSKGYIIAYRNATDFKIGSPKDWDVAIEIFVKTSSYWHQRGVRFYVLLMDNDYID